uniref:Uncharacterized protein n=1 Tax=Solanum tuberosum TaxID=4113 RepID=M1DPA8_SOLTU
MDDEKGVPCLAWEHMHGNRCTLKDLSVGQHHAWIIAWSVGGLTKRGGAIEVVLHSASRLPNWRLAKPSWREFQNRQLAQVAMKEKDAHLLFIIVSLVRIISFGVNDAI